MTLKTARKPRSNPRYQSTVAHVDSGHLELIQLSLGTSGAFVGGQIPLIPTFEPTSRLGVLALQYSQYQILSSRVEFKSYTSTNTTGRIALAFTYDTVDPDPVSCPQIIQISKSRNGVVRNNLTVSSPGRNSEKRKYAVIAGPTFASLTSVDKQIYTPATVVYGTDLSAQSGLFIGSLIWHYRIAFFNPNVLTGSVSSVRRNILTIQAEQDQAEDEV